MSSPERLRDQRLLSVVVLPEKTPQFALANTRICCNRYIFMNVISGQLSTTRVPSGNWGQLSLPGPELKNIPDNSIVVGVFHTHPNPDGAGTCEEHDIQESRIDGVPDVVRGAKGPFPCGVERRLHLAGFKGYPGPSVGDPP